jgi:hypothetical protein
MAPSGKFMRRIRAYFSIDSLPAEGEPTSALLVELNGGPGGGGASPEDLEGKGGGGPN